MRELKILYLEDSAQDAEMTARVLKKAGLKFYFRLVDKHDEYTQALAEEQPDLVLADHSLFHFNSLEALQIFKSFNFQIPFILVTGTVSEEFAVTILKEGANDYVLKDNLARLPNAIKNALDSFRVKREKQQYFENIIANEKMWKQAEQLAHIGSWEVDLVTGVSKWSDEIYRIYGYQPGEVTPGYEIFELHVHPEDVLQFQRTLKEVITSSGTLEIEFRIIDKKGNTKHIHSRLTTEHNEKGTPIKQMGFNHDITERKEAAEKLLAKASEIGKLEKELVQHQLSQQKLITEVTIKAQEKERNELARELHDNINQMLATVKMYLSIAKEDEAVRENLVMRSHTIVDHAIEEIRRLSKSLLAPSLGEVGIFEALTDLVNEMKSVSKFDVHLDFENLTSKEIEDNIELMLYRIVQEQVNNIIKYADARHIEISLKITPQSIHLIISDDGRGFDVQKKAGGIGLKNIRSRVEFYSGQLTIKSAPGQGCTMDINIPIQSDD